MDRRSSLLYLCLYMFDFTVGNKNQNSNRNHTCTASLQLIGNGIGPNETETWLYEDYAISNEMLVNESSYNLTSMTYSTSTCAFLCNKCCHYFGLQRETRKCYCIPSAKAQKYNYSSIQHCYDNNTCIYKQSKGKYLNLLKYASDNESYIVNLNISCAVEGNGTGFECNTTEMKLPRMRCTNLGDNNLIKAFPEENDKSVATTDIGVQHELTIQSDVHTTFDKTVSTKNATETVNFDSSTIISAMDNVTGYEDNSFDIRCIIGFTLASCVFVVLITVIAVCLFRQTRIEKNSQTVSTNEEKESFAENKLIIANSKDGADKIYSQCNGDESTQNICSQPQSSDGSEYHHLDFTLRSDSKPKFVSDGEYARPRTNTVSVFDQPWDAGTSKINKLFSQVRTSVYDSAKNIKNSVMKREKYQENPTRSNKTKYHCNDWQPPFLRYRESLKHYTRKKVEDNSIEINEDRISESNRFEEEMNSGHKLDGLFPVLPYSERLNVVCDNIYSEPINKRISFRNRLSMLSSFPLKPFGYKLDLRRDSRNSSMIREKSRIYSMAEPIDENDESVC